MRHSVPIAKVNMQLNQVWFIHLYWKFFAITTFCFAILVARATRVCCPGGCMAGRLYLCTPCDQELHVQNGPHLLHRRDALDASTGGFSPMKLDPRIFSLSTCSICTQKFNPNNGSYTHVSSHTVLLQTESSGEVQVRVDQYRCSSCTSIVGRSAAEFGCVTGGSNQWFTQALIDNNRLIYESSGNALSTVAIAKAHERSCAERGGGSSGARAREAAGTRAFR